MTDESSGLIHSVSEAGVTAEHPIIEELPVLVAPTTDDEFNTIRVAPVAVACWLVEDICFEFDSSVLGPKVAPGLAHLAKLFEKYPPPSIAERKIPPEPGYPLSLFGHADPVGQDDYNKDLSGRRAKAIYGLLTRDSGSWEGLYSRPSSNDKWGTKSLELMMNEVHSSPIGTNPDVSSYQHDKAERKRLYEDYMGRLWGLEFKLEKRDFLAAGTDPDGKGDYQGCSEFNPILLFSQEEEEKYQRDADKTERNAENQPNRRVMVLVFRKGSRVDPKKWPCPRAKDGTAECEDQFWSPPRDRKWRHRHLPGKRREYGETKDTFACRFYDQLVGPVYTSPCEQPSKLTTLHMHLDADRDGKVDDDCTGLDKWEWGKGKKGAIILCNNDDDENASRSDNEDDKVNLGNDKDELAPLVFRRTGPAPPSSWEAFLEIDAGDKDKIRIFDSRSTGAKEIIGPQAGHKYKFPDLNFTEKEFGMEALQYAHGEFDGEITLIFTVKMGSGNYSEKCKIRVAPWMMPNHLDKAEKVYVVDAGDYNRRFREELKKYVVDDAGCSLQEYPSNDIWMQDCMEWGYSSLPNAGFRSVLRAPRNRPLLTFPKTLRKADLGYQEQGTPHPCTTFDCTGNLEVSPPVTSKAGQKYPWGRIYFGPGRDGEWIDADWKSFLKKQVVQEPIEICTEWLLVGHVDEIISFVPSSEGKGFKLLLASPRLAYEILNDNKSNHPTAKLLTGRTYPPDQWHPYTRNVEVTIEDFLDKGLTSLEPKFTNTYLKDYNDFQQSRLDVIRGQLERKLGLDDSDRIDVPVIFADIRPGLGLADALTANMVNMLVINKHCIFPKPFGPVVNGIDLFQADLEEKLKAQGLNPHPIDDWYEYHVKSGEVHCGTNTLRVPTSAKWWEFEP